MQTYFDDAITEDAFRATWRKLPKYVRGDIDGKVTYITNRTDLLPISMQDYLQENPTIGGVAFRDGMQVNVYINTPYIPTPRRTRFVIAHELAHVHLNHCDSEKDMPRAEDEANVLAQLWGFSYRL